MHDEARMQKCSLGRLLQATRARVSFIRRMGSVSRQLQFKRTHRLTGTLECLTEIVASKITVASSGEVKCAEKS